MHGSWSVDRIGHAGGLDDLARFRIATVNHAEIVAGAVLDDFMEGVAAGTRSAERRPASGRHADHRHHAGCSLDRRHHPDVLMTVQDQLGPDAFDRGTETLAVGELAP